MLCKVGLTILAPHCISMCRMTIQCSATHSKHARCFKTCMLLVTTLFKSADPPIVPLWPIGTLQPLVRSQQLRESLNPHRNQGKLCTGV